MSTQYPGALDSATSLATNRQPLDTIPPSDHNDLAVALIALETKLGIGAGAPTGAGQILVSTGPGATGWVTQNNNLQAATTVSQSVTQANHGFTVGQVLYLVNGTYTLAQASGDAISQVVGIVSAVANSNNFTITTEGYITGLSGLTAGTVYYLSPTAPGTLTSTKPTTAGYIIKPLFIADTGISGYFHNHLGDMVGDNSGGTVTKSTIGLGNVDNTSDATKNSAVATLLNKKIVPRVQSTTSLATLAPNSDAQDGYYITALAANATIAAPTGSPNDGQPLMIRIKDNGTARTLTWNAVYRAVGVTLPTTTVVSKTHYIYCEYNGPDAKWDAIEVRQEGLVTGASVSTMDWHRYIRGIAPYTSTGTWALGTGSGWPETSWWVNSSATINDSLTFRLWFDVGVYSVTRTYKGGTTMGIAAVSVNGVTIGGGSDDTYATANQVASYTTTGLSIGVAGQYDVKFTCTGKNASSTGNSIGLFSFAVDRTS